MIAELAHTIWREPRFKNELEAIRREHLGRSLLGVNEHLLDHDAANRLLQAAAIFSQMQDSKFKAAAYEIATTAYRLWGGDLPGLRSVLFIILSRLGNFPAIRYLSNTLNTPGDVTTFLACEAIGHREANTVYVAGEEITFTDFQRGIWDRLTSGESLAISAPTSAGKSFLLQSFLKDRFDNAGKFRAVYLVPTRALISQVSESLLISLANLLDLKPVVSTLPILPDDSIPDRAAFVMTQERLQILLDTQPDLSFHLVIVDEAQEIASDGRGVLLQAVLEEVQRRKPKAQFFFIAPNLANPDAFKTLFRLDDLNAVRSTEQAVTQNLIFLDVDPVKNDTVTVSVGCEGQRQPIGLAQLDLQLYSPEHKLAFLSAKFGADGQSLIYAGGQAVCEEIASSIEQFCEDTIEEQSPRLLHLSRFIRDSIHPDYLLAETVKHRVGFHYGNMPALLRKAIEDAFNDGALQYLVSTSTLLHGVNLPAKNIFLNRPTKGDNVPISTHDFWNLVGRAGRMGKDFEGKVFLIDYDSWPSAPLTEPKEQQITPTLVEHLTTGSAELLDFINQTEHRSGSNVSLENSFVKLFSDFRNGRLRDTLSRAGDKLSADMVSQLRDALERANKSVGLPTDIIDKNLSVSVYRQQALYDYLLKRIREKGPAYVTPMHPLQDFKLAKTSLASVFKRIHTYLEVKPSRDRSQWYFAPMALRWMRGDPLPMLIGDAIVYKRREAPNTKTASVIRNVLREVERDLRFRYVKFVNCYLLLLSHALTETGYDEEVRRIPPLTMFLEMGASSPVMLSLMALGLSRISAKAIADKIGRKDLNVAATQKWLRGRNLHALDISPVVIAEVQRLQLNPARQSG